MLTVDTHSKSLIIRPFTLVFLQNDITDILDLTFSMDADEEKHILYEKTEVLSSAIVPSPGLQLRNNGNHIEQLKAQLFSYITYRGCRFVLRE